jgi:uncharacterized membrane protein (UPF0127 family)
MGVINKNFSKARKSIFSFRPITHYLLPTTLCLFLFISTTYALPELPQKVKIGKKTVILEIADEKDEITEGLSDRTDLEPDHGMLFCFPDTARRIFWMYHCSAFDIDIAYVDSHGVIRDIQRMTAESFDTPPELLKTYPSKTSDIQYVIEMMGGWYAEHNIQIGDSTDCYRFTSKVEKGSFR